MRSRLVVLGVALAALGLADVCRAQSRSGGSSMGSSGMSSGMSSMGSSMGMGSSGMGSMGGGMGSMGSMGSSGSSSGMFGSRSLGSGTLSAGNRSFGGSSFMNNRRTTNSFVGGNSQTALANMQQMSGSMATGVGVGGNRGLTGMQGMRGNNNRNRMGMNGMQGLQSRANVPQFRAALRADFEHRAPEVSAISANLSRRIGDAHSLTINAPVDVVVDGQTVILRGEVATEHDRRVAEQLARLEPGVWKIQNELVVSSQKPAVQPQQPAPALTAPAAPLPPGPGAPALPLAPPRSADE